MTEKRANQRETRLAEPVCLSRILDNLSFPIRIAEGWVSPSDFQVFIEEVEKQVRALAGFVVAHLEKHPAALREADRETVRILEAELAGLQKNWDSLDQLRAMQRHAATNFADEAEELRKLRSGELKSQPPANGFEGTRP